MSLIPTKKNNWEYMFLIDIDGHSLNKKINKTLQEIKENVNFLKSRFIPKEYLNV